MHAGVSLCGCDSHVGGLMRFDSQLTHRNVGNPPLLDLAQVDDVLLGLEASCDGGKRKLTIASWRLPRFTVLHTVTAKGIDHNPRLINARNTGVVACLAGSRC